MMSPSDGGVPFFESFGLTRTWPADLAHSIAASNSSRETVAKLVAESLKA